MVVRPVTVLNRTLNVPPVLFVKVNVLLEYVAPVTLTSVPPVNNPVIVESVPVPAKVIVPLEYVPPVAPLMVVVVGVPPLEVTLKTFEDNVTAVVAFDKNPVTVKVPPVLFLYSFYVQFTNSKYSHPVESTVLTINVFALE